MAAKGCGTCRDRRILCDRRIPTCSNCSKGNRKCQGYGMRLSWPKDNDVKRSLVGKSPRSLTQARGLNLSDARLINVTSFDMDMYHHLSVFRSNKFERRMIIPISMGGNPHKLNDGRRSLLQYFQTAVCHSLRTWDHDPIHVGNIVLRMAVAGDSPASTALLQALFAISSMHRYGIHPQAANLKISALRALGAASRENFLTADQAKQHVAAGMLLYLLEMMDITCTLNQWTWHIAGVKDVLQAASIDSSEYDADFATLLDWVSYHDLLARFSMLHYRIDSNGAKNLAGPFVQTGFCIKKPLKTSHKKPSSFSILELLIEVCETVSPKAMQSKTGQTLLEYKAYLHLLQFRIRKSPLIATNTSDPDALPIMELYQLSTLIYLERASGNTLSPEKTVHGWIERAFTIFSQLNACGRQLPIFILGGEARTDEQRIVVLDLIARSEATVLSKCTQYMVQSVWTQDDLAGERGLDYVEKLGAIISSCDIMMTFV